MNEGYGDYDSNDEKRRKRFLSTVKFCKKIFLNMLNTSFIPPKYPKNINILDRLTCQYQLALQTMVHLSHCVNQVTHEFSHLSSNFASFVTALFVFKVEFSHRVVSACTDNVPGDMCHSLWSWRQVEGR